MLSEKIIKIGGASGAIIDTELAVGQLLRVPGLNYLIFDYLSEGAMAIFGRLRRADPTAGYAAEFAEGRVARHLPEIQAKGVKLVANAGGMNPRGLAALLRQKVEALGLDLKVAAVFGDDLTDRMEELRQAGTKEMFSGAPVPEGIISANAYLGALPIAEALAAGADIVVTGRVVDSALVLGPLIHEFGWKATDYDRLAAGTMIGHLLECGAQITGGTFTDWQDVPNWEDMGFPVGECHANGDVVITKLEGTGGLVTKATVCEQLLYEVGDPQCYIVPDVVCDFSQARIEQIGTDRVKMSGVKGYPPTAQYKVCLTYENGWRSVCLQPIIGIDAMAKARRQTEAILKRTRTILKQRNMPDWRSTHVEILGGEVSYGARARVENNRDVICKIVVDHDLKEAADMFWREQNAAVMSMSVGTSIGLSLTAPTSFPVTAIFLFLIDKEQVPAFIEIDGQIKEIDIPTAGGFTVAAIKRADQPPPLPAHAAGAQVAVPLIDVAWARSGDKGNLFNVGVIARDPAYLPYIRAALTTEALTAWYAHVFNPGAEQKVDIYEAPGFDALNIVVHDSMAGGINESPRLDPVAKSMAQILLEIPVKLPSDLAKRINKRA